MTAVSVAWAFHLTQVSAVAKLCAIYFADNAGPLGSKTLDAEELANWCCADPRDLDAALSELDAVGVEIIRKDCAIEFQLPAAAWRQLSNQLDHRDTQRASVYVMTGKFGVKIGVSTYPPKRLGDLKLAILDGTIRLHWAHEVSLRQAYRAERLAHEHWRGKETSPLSKEWFDIDVKAAIKSAEDALRKVIGG